MPQKAWSAKRERQYAHIKDSLLVRGKTAPLAEEIAARVVNKERAQHGESMHASPSSINDMSAGRRGGLRSRSGAGGWRPGDVSYEVERSLDQKIVTGSNGST